MITKDLRTTDLKFLTDEISGLQEKIRADDGTSRYARRVVGWCAELQAYATMWAAVYSTKSEKEKEKI